MRREIYHLFVGFLFFVAVTGIFAQDIYTIESLHYAVATGAIMDGTDVTVLGYYTSLADGELVSLYDDFKKDEPMPAWSVVHIEGAPPPDSMLYGGLLTVRGILTHITDSLYIYPEDTFDIILSVAFPDDYELILRGDSTGTLYRESPRRDAIMPSPMTCDSCKFAILISGGVNNDNNHPRYWNNIKMLYQHKLTEGYCKSNIKVYYFDGNPRDPADSIPVTGSCTVANIQAAHRDVARKAADCRRADPPRPVTVQKMVTNHGAEDGDIWMVGWHTMTPGQFRAAEQEVIDSGATDVYDEFVECYGGIVTDSLKRLNDRGRARIHANSGAGHQPHKSRTHPDGGYSEFLKTKIDSLEGGYTYDEAVRAAANKYDEYLQELLGKKHSWLARARAWLVAHPPGSVNDTIRNRIIRDTVSVRNDSITTAGYRKKSPMWKSVPMTHYCQWERIVCPPGGQVRIEYSGDGSHCGNSTLWEWVYPPGYFKRAAVWNWNVPGSAGYSAGNERRVINSDLTSTGIFWLHNDDSTHRVIITTAQTQDIAETPSNLYEYAGFSIGGDDDASAEFGSISAPYYFIDRIDSLGLNLDSVPQLLCSEGLPMFEFTFNVGDNDYWSQMQLYIDALNVVTPGYLVVSCETAEFPLDSIWIDGPGVYTLYLGDMRSSRAEALSPTTISSMSMEFRGVQLELDSWGLRSIYSIPGAVTTYERTVPKKVILHGAYPNPFNETTTFAFSLPKTMDVSLVVYDFLGHKVSTIMDNKLLEAGLHTTMFDAGAQPSGIYFLRLTTPDGIYSSKALLLK